MIKSVWTYGKSYLKLYAFWFLLFLFQRILFLLFYSDKLENTGVTDIFGIFYHAIRLDFATASLLLLPLLVYLPLKTILPRFGHLFFRILFLLTLVYSVLIHCGELNIYEEWNHKLSSRIFTHLSNPDEVARTAEFKHFIFFALFLLLEFTWAYLVWKFFFQHQFFQQTTTKHNWSYHLASALAFGVSFVGLRGGLQPIPININSAMFSNNYVVNDIAVNSTYFSSKDFLLFRRGSIGNLYPEMAEAETEQRVKMLYAATGEHQNIFLKKKDVNIVLILLESWSANAVSATSDLKNTTPNFDALAQEGYLFDNIYSCGWTSEIGNSSTLSGYPALPEISVTMQSDKSRSLPSLNQDLKQKGYYSSYLFSGDLKYGNIGGYLLNHGFDAVKDELDFPSGIQKRGKLNYYDADLYDFLLAEINASPQPFFHCAFTGSTHSPFDQPSPKQNNFEGEEEDFMNALIYSDEALGAFMAKAKKQSWYENTLFVFMADHGHAAPHYRNPSDINFFRIPLLFYGEVIQEAYRGTKNNIIGSQSDFAKTLLNQMGMATDRYPWSKDLMDTTIHPFALHTLRMGYGYLSNEGNYAYSFDTQKEHLNDISEEGKLNSYALINALLEDFETR
ncbi:Phosphoglycerol transferase MdoB [Lishizhenia tianjinensis]|uniref:Phosphoglycerol transferase MdoB n=1 Tax=Lishizhenia tianjinensis TaxID=477690 RepID=A0A1I7BEL1_9FLAO|nr:LTA synthase family protein [Lishizhenia tianjinensis]SFT85542.1 Phosphoglycerol transferase MdoB [Lishizhenia tianjinensis]